MIELECSRTNLIWYDFTCGFFCFLQKIILLFAGILYSFSLGFNPFLAFFNSQSCSFFFGQKCRLKPNSRYLTSVCIHIILDFRNNLNAWTSVRFLSVFMQFSVKISPNNSFQPQTQWLVCPSPRLGNLRSTTAKSETVIHCPYFAQCLLLSLSFC